MTPLPVEDLLAPLSAVQPCGPDLAYAPEFSELEVIAAGKPERQTGDTLIPAEPPQWPQVYEAALALARRSRDLRLAVLLTRASARIHGMTGYASGLNLVSQLMVRYWDSVHPQLDVTDNSDPTMRMNSLRALCHPQVGLADLRSAGIVAAGHKLTVRLVELGLTNAEAMPGEVRPTPQGLAQGLREAVGGDDSVYGRLSAVHESAISIDKLLNERVGTAGPDFRPLLQITQALARAAAAATGAAMPSAAPAGVDGAAAAVGAIQSREDVVRTLGQICEWIECHEPSNPAPILIRRAQRLMSKSFVDLVRDLAPGGLAELELIAGVAKS